MKGYSRVIYSYQEETTSKARLLCFGGYRGVSLWLPKVFLRSYHPDSKMIRIADWLIQAKLDELKGKRREAFLSSIQEGDWK